MMLMADRAVQKAHKDLQSQNYFSKFCYRQNRRLGMMMAFPFPLFDYYQKNEKKLLTKVVRYVSVIKKSPSPQVDPGIFSEEYWGSF